MTTQIIRTSAGLREALFEEPDRLRAGESDAQKASAFARLASVVVNTVHMEMKYHQMNGHGKKANDRVAPALEPMQLGAPAGE